MNHIIPTIFATNKREFDSRFSKMVKISKNIQIDFMDGKFVRKRSINVREVPDLHKYDIEFEAHLMIESPFDYIGILKNKGFKKVIFHYEAYWDTEKCRELCKVIHDEKMKAWIAINPETSIAKITGLYKELDGVLILGAHPGREHQHLESRVYRKIRELRNNFPILRIQIDIGVNPGNISMLRKAGVNYFNSGSFISDSKNPEKELKILENS